MTGEVVTWNSADGVCTVRLDRPPVNALGGALVAGLSAALDAFDTSDDRVLVLTSALDRFFMAGADIKAMAGYSRGEFAAYGASLRVPFERIARHDRPSIAAIDGAALGGGLELAVAATLRVAGRDATLGVPEIKLGLIPGAGGTQRLPQLVGRGRALDMMLTPRTVDAAEAHAIGLVDRLVDAGTAAAAAQEWARTLAAFSAPAMTAVLACVEDADDLPLDKGLAGEAERVTALFGQADAAEGLAAFVERRPPRFG